MSYLAIHFLKLQLASHWERPSCFPVKHWGNWFLTGRLTEWVLFLPFLVSSATCVPWYWCSWHWFCGFLPSWSIKKHWTVPCVWKLIHAGNKCPFNSWPECFGMYSQLQQEVPAAWRQLWHLRLLWVFLPSHFHADIGPCSLTHGNVSCNFIAVQ